jgi:hypothetical protein
MNLIQLPPIIVHSSKIEKAAEAINNLFGIECVKECYLEENNKAYIKFSLIPSNLCTDFYNKLSGRVEFTYNGYTYYAISQYINI